MSTGADCQIIERKPGQWHWRLQLYPYGMNEEYEEHGPFRSEEAALENMHSQRANPGGYFTIPYEEPADGNVSTRG